MVEEASSLICWSLIWSCILLTGWITSVHSFCSTFGLHRLLWLVNAPPASFLLLFDADHIKPKTGFQKWLNRSSQSERIKLRKDKKLRLIVLSVPGVITLVDLGESHYFQIFFKCSHQVLIDETQMRSTEVKSSLVAPRLFGECYHLVTQHQASGADEATQREVAPTRFTLSKYHLTAKHPLAQETTQGSFVIVYQASRSRFFI